MTGLTTRRVAPFGHPGINACVPLPQAYRSLPRPSSPPCAQASPTCLLSLDYNTRQAKPTRYFSARPARTRSCPRVIEIQSQCRSVTAASIADDDRSTIFPTFRCQTADLRTAPGQSRTRESLNSRIEIEMGAEAATSERFRRGPPRGAVYSRLRKGGDPAAGSPTATLLRLRPSHYARLRPLGPLRVPTRTSGARSFHGVTGGVYKARERIHRGVADPRLLAIPASCRRVADDNPH